MTPFGVSERLWRFASIVNTIFDNLRAISVLEKGIPVLSTAFALCLADMRHCFGMADVAVAVDVDVVIVVVSVIVIAIVAVVSSMSLMLSSTSSLLSSLRHCRRYCIVSHTLSLSLSLSLFSLSLSLFTLSASIRMLPTCPVLELSGLWVCCCVLSVVGDSCISSDLSSSSPRSSTRTPLGLATHSTGVPKVGIPMGGVLS